MRNQLQPGIRIGYLVRDARWKVSAIQRSESIGPAFDLHLRLTLKDGYRFAAWMGVVGKAGGGFECGQAGAESCGATLVGGKRNQAYSLWRAVRRRQGSGRKDLLRKRHETTESLNALKISKNDHTILQSAHPCLESPPSFILSWPYIDCRSHGIPPFAVV